MDKIRYGVMLKSRREAAGLTLAEVARELRIDADTLGKREAGKTKGAPDADFVNGIAQAVPNCAVLDQLVAMGYRLSVGGFGPDELALIETYRSLSPAGRESLLAVAQSLHEHFPAVVPAA